MERRRLANELRYGFGLMLAELESAALRLEQPEHVAPAALFLISSLCGDRTGHVLAACGSRMYAFKVTETQGKFKDEASGVWTPEEIAEHWDSIVK